MSSSPPRPSSPQGEGGQDSTPENCFGPDSIRAMCDTIGTFLSEEASRELVRTFISLNDLVVLCKIREKLNCWKDKLLIPKAFGYEV